MYDDAEDQFFQGYPSQQRRPRPVLAAVVASVITTIVVFFVMRELDKVGAFGGPPRPRAAQAGLPGGAVQVPSLVGVKLEQARELLKGRGLLISIAEERDDATRPAGAILAQNPLPGSETPPGTTVQLVVARAVASVIVPPVAGQKPEDATAALTAAGFKLGPPRAAPPGAAVANGLVAGTEPAAGASVPTGTQVSLLVAGAGGKVVPNVVGMRLTRGKKVLEDADFKTGPTRYRYDPCCGEYIILQQNPPAGQSAAPGSSVELIVNEPG